MRNVWLVLICIGLWSFMCHCAVNKKQILPDDSFVMYPAAPDTGRIQFLTSISSELELEKKKKSFFKNYVTGEEEEVKLISKPFGISSNQGEIFVLDLKLKGFVVINLAEQEMVYFIPEGKGKLIQPLNCDVDEDGNIYVADYGRKQVVVFSSEYRYLGAIGGEELLDVVDVKCDEDYLYVANSKGHQIMVYQKDRPYELVKHFPEAEPEDDEFLFQPKSISVKNNHIYVCDWGEFNIKVFDKAGILQRTIGSQGQNIGQFARPKGIDVDAEGNIYALDAGFENAQIFNGNGQLLLFFGGANTGNGAMYMPITIHIDYSNLDYFKQFVDPEYELKYLIYVCNQYGGNKLNVYGRIEYKRE